MVASEAKLHYEKMVREAVKGNKTVVVGEAKLDYKNVVREETRAEVVTHTLMTSVCGSQNSVGKLKSCFFCLENHMKSIDIANLTVSDSIIFCWDRHKIMLFQSCDEANLR